jgi:hypothetical protein
VPPRRRIKITAGLRAVQTWLADPPAADRDTLALAVRFSLEELAARHPGRTCEVRVPPFGVVQCLSGPEHTRGTPPNVVQTDAGTWLRLATGADTWTQAVDGGTVLASGERSDLGPLLPLFEQLSSTV